MEKEAARQQRAAARRHTEAVRQAERAQKAEEQAKKLAMRAAEANRKKAEKEAKAAHIASMEALAEQYNTALASNYDDIANLLSATLSVDDYVDLETLRRTTEDPPGSLRRLEIPITPPKEIPEPERPTLSLPEAPRGLFASKRKHANAVAEAEAAFFEEHAVWERKRAAIQAQRKEEYERYTRDEQERLHALKQERSRFEAEVQQHNDQLDTLITNLAYGSPEAVQEYVSIVVANSVYPQHFQVDHSFSFESETAELIMRVSVPPPGSLPMVKAYRYNKTAGEITTTALSQKALKDRYAGAIYQVGIRSFHEVFEADRRGIIKMISLEVGTQDIDPATGNEKFIPFLAAAADRDTFINFDLSAVVPVATLKHLGAAISKDPYGLVAADTTGVRKS